MVTMVQMVMGMMMVVTVMERWMMGGELRHWRIPQLLAKAQPATQA